MISLWVHKSQGITFTKGYGKAYEQPEEEIHGVRPGRIQSIGTSVPVELGCVSLSVRGLQTCLEVHQALHYCSFMEASSHRHGQLLKAFIDSPPSLGNRQ